MIQDAQLKSLRNLVITIDAVLGTMGTAPPGTLSESSLAELRVEWAKLVDVLALGPAPDIRACPACGSTVMRMATRCGYCWRTLPTAHENGA